MEIRDLKFEFGQMSFGFYVAASLALGSSLLTGCNLQVSVSSAEAASQPTGLLNSPTDEIGGLEPTSNIQNQLMNSYTHDAMSDFIISNSGAQRRGF